MDEHALGSNPLTCHSFVVVNGLCRGDQECWTSGNNIFWPEKWLLKEQPKASLLHFTPKILQNSPWEDLVKEGDSLLRDLDGYRSVESDVGKCHNQTRGKAKKSQVPLIFLCYGLGGITFLKVTTFYVPRIIP